MKYFYALILVLGLSFGKSFGQCNTDVSICTPGVAGPFNFIPASMEVGSCQDFLNGVGAPNYAYILLNITASGPLSLLIDGDGTSGYIDVSIFNIPSGVDPCVAIQDVSNEIGCNYATFANGCNQFGTYFPCTSTVPAPNVNAGDLLMIVVEDWSNAQNTFTLELGPVPNAQTGPYDATINPQADLLASDAPVAMTSVTGGGTWSASCGACIDASSGVFDPSVAGVGSHTICHDGGAVPCDGNDCIVVNVLDPCNLDLSASTTNVTCNGDDDGTAAVTETGSIGAVTYDWDSGQTSASITGLAPGTYECIATDSYGCEDTIEVTITEPTDLSATATPTDAGCTDDDGQVVAGESGGTTPYTYSWAHDGSETNGTITGLSSGTYVVTVMDDNGCTDQATAAVALTGVIVPSFSYNGNQCLAGNSFVFTNTGTSAGATFSWDFGDGNTSTSEDPTHTYAAIGSYTVQQVITAGGCSDSTTMTIQVFEDPTSSISGVDPLCAGSSTGSVDLTVADGTSPYGYTWSNGATSEDLTNVADGTYNVTITDNNGCQTTNTITLTAPSSLSVTVSGNDASCEGVCDGDATATPIGGTGPFTYVWDDPGAQTGATASALCDGSIGVVVTDANGCTTSGSTTISNSSGITVSTTSTNSTCSMANGSATASPSGGTGPYTYLWTPTSLTTQSISSISAGAYDVTVTDAAGCQVSTTEMVTDVSTLAISIGVVTDVTCNGGTNGRVTSTASGGAGGYTYSWTGSSSTSSIASGVPAGTYTVTVTDASGCTAQATGTVNEPDAIVITTTQVDANCLQNDGSATCTVTGGTVASDYSYTWDDGASTISTTASATGLVPGTYNLTVQDDNTCTEATSVTINNLPGGTVSATSNDISCFGICDGDGTASMTGGTSPFSYVWDDPSTTTGVNVSSLCAGTFNVTSTDAVGCTSTTSITISEPTELVASIATSSDVTCFGAADGSATVSISGGTSGFTYSWNDPSTQTSATATGLDVGGYTVTITDANSCQDAVGVTISQPTQFTVSGTTVSAHCSLADGSATVAVSSGGVGAISYSWSPGGATGATLSNVVAGTYTCTAADATGCTASTTVTISDIAAGVATITNIIEPTCDGVCDAQASVSMSGTGTSPFTYSWDSGNNTASATNGGMCDGAISVSVTDANGCVSTDNYTLTAPDALFATVAITPADCYGECTVNMQASTTGGTSPFTYAWDDPLNQASHNAVDLCSDVVYTVTVTDANGCQTTKQGMSVSPDEIITDSTVVDASCGLANGSACVSVSGGTGVLGVLWQVDNSTSLCNSALLAGTYLIDVTDENGCLVTTTVTLADQAGPTATFTNITAPTCLGETNGLATAVPTLGTGPYTFLWSASAGNQTTPTATNLPAGTHTVTVFDDVGCSGSAAVTVDPGAVLSFSGVLNDPVCFEDCNGSIEATVGGGVAPYTYAWTDPSAQTTSTASNLCDGTYILVATDANGCIGQNSWSLSHPAQFTIAASMSPLSCFNSCDGQTSVTNGNGVSPISYTWNDGNAQTGVNAIDLCAGTYVVNGVDADGCTATDTIVVTQPNVLDIEIDTMSNVTCNGMCNGYAMAGVTGGTMPYSFLWSSGETTATGTNWCPGTYTCVVTDANGCTDSVSVTITEPTALTASMTSVDVDCYGNSTGQAQYTVAGGTLPYSYQWYDLLFQTTATADSLAAGVHTVIATDGNGCTISAVVNINQPTPMMLTGSITDANCGQSNGSVCVQVSGGVLPYSFAWNDSLSQTTACALNIPSGLYGLDFTDGNGCLLDTSFIVNDLAGPDITISSASGISCFGETDGFINMSATNGTLPYASIEWYDGDGNDMGMSGTTGLVGLSEDCYSMQIIDAAGCVATETYCVVEPSLLNSAIVATTDALCYQSCDGTATYLYLGGTAPYSVLWSDGQLTDVAVNLCAGSYSATVTDANGCTSQAVDSIAQPTELVGTLVGTTEALCADSCNGTMTASFTGGTLPHTYSWDQSTSVETFAAGLCAGGYIVQATDANGCVEYVNGEVTEPLKLSMVLSMTPATCGDCNGVSMANVTGGVAPYNYLWSSVQTDSIASGLCEGSYTMSLTDANGCELDQAIYVEQQASPVIDSFTVVHPTCFGDNDGSAQVNFTGGTEPFAYSWFGTGQNVQNAVALADGSHCVVVTDSNGCEVAGCTELAEPDLLVNFGDGSTTICHGDTTNIFANAMGGTTPYTFNWEAPFDTLSGSGPHSVSPEVTTSYCFNVVDDHGCTTSSACVDITVLPALVIAASADSTICENSDATLNSVASGGNGDPYSYIWYADGDSANVLSTASDTILNTADSTWYYVMLMDGCSRPAIDSILIDTEPAPVAYINVLDPVGCVPAPTAFFANSDIAVSFEWDFQCDGTYEDSLTTNEAEFFYQDTGIYDVCLQVTSALGCSAVYSQPASVTVNSSPVANFNFLTGDTSTVLSNYAVVLDSSIGAINYYWDFDQDWNYESNDTLVTYEYEDTGVYYITLVVENEFGCTDTITKPYHLLDDQSIFVPSAFTPNGDGRNDVFQAQGVGLVQTNFHMYIQNRWGQLIYEGHHPLNSWDGTFQGQMVPQGVYLWQIDTEDEKGNNFTMKGHVTVIY